MKRLPNLITPVIILACCLIVAGGIASGLSSPEYLDSLYSPAAGSGNGSGATVLQEDGNVTVTPNLTPAGNETPVLPTVTTTQDGLPTITETLTPEPGAPSASEWSLPNGDAANTRAVDESTITSSTVSSLTERWQAEIGTGSMGNPIVANDRVFVQDARGTVYAFDLATGEELWRQAATNQTPTIEPTVTETVMPNGTVTVEPTGDGGDQTIADLVASNTELSTLATAVRQAGLVEVLSGSENYTVFAPTNAAFDALSPGTVESLLANTTALADVVTYHAVAGEFTAAELMNGTTLTTVQGQVLNVTTAADGTVQVDGARVVQADIRASNGIVHIIDAVMIPPGMEVEPTATETQTGNETVEPTPAVELTTTLTQEPTAVMTMATQVADTRFARGPLLAQEPNETANPTPIESPMETPNETPTLIVTPTTEPTNGNQTVAPTVTVDDNATATPTAGPGPGTGAGNASALFQGPHGPAAAEGRLFLPVLPTSIAALDQATGEVLWTTELTTDSRMVIAMQPSVRDGLVFVSTLPGPELNRPEGGGIGTLYALDVATGAITWSWATVDSPDIWGNPDVNSGGGAFYGPAFDENGNSYWSTAGPNPAPGTTGYPNAGSRPGPNLWTNGVGLIAAASGTPGWFTQAIPADIYDHDFIAPPLLATGTIADQPRDLVIGAGENGRVIAFDRQTGAMLWSTMVGRHENDNLERIPAAGLTVWPGALGGVHSPMAYSDGYVYVASIELPTSYMPSGITSSLDLAGARGILSAVNISTGRIGWQHTYDSAVTGGATVVGDVVMTATRDGRIHVLEKSTGAHLYERFLAGPIQSTPAVSGDTVIWQAGTGANAKVFAFSVEGAEPTPEPTLTAEPTLTTEPTLTIEPNVTGTVEPTLTVEPNATTTVTPNETPGVENESSIRLLSPTAGAALPGNEIPVLAAVTNFTLVNPGSGTAPKVPGEGHIHYFLDVQPPTDPDQPSLTPEGTVVEIANITYTWTNVTPGSHTVWVMLVNNDHTPVIPLAMQSVTVEVGGASPTETGTVTATAETTAMTPFDGDTLAPILRTGDRGRFHSLGGR